MADDLQLRKELHGAAYAERYETHQDPLRLDRLMAHVALPPGAQVLDVGCGNARVLEHLKRQEGALGGYLGVDFSAEFLALAEARRAALDFAKARFLCGSLADVRRERGEGWVDVALAIDVSEHVPDDEWLAACRDVYALLRPGGAFYLHTPNREFVIERMKAHNFILRQFPEHVAVRTPRANAEILRAAGFTTVEVDALPHYNVLRGLHLFAKWPLIGKSLRARLFMTARK